MSHPLFPRVLVISGTGTDVGKTVVTAALAALGADHGLRVAVVKPVQTGELPGPAGDLSTVRRLSGVTSTHELAGSPTRCPPRRPRGPPGGRRSTWPPRPSSSRVSTRT